MRFMKTLIIFLLYIVTNSLFCQQPKSVFIFFEKYGNNSVKMREISDCFYLSLISGTDTIVPFKRKNEILIPTTLKDKVSIFVEYDGFVSCFYDVPINLIKNSKNNKWIFQVFDKPYINNETKEDRKYILAFFNIGIEIEGEDTR